MLNDNIAEILNEKVRSVVACAPPAGVAADRSSSRSRRRHMPPPQRNHRTRSPAVAAHTRAQSVVDIANDANEELRQAKAVKKASKYRAVRVRRPLACAV